MTFTIEEQLFGYLPDLLEPQTLNAACPPVSKYRHLTLDLELHPDPPISPRRFSSLLLPLQRRHFDTRTSRGLIEKARGSESEGKKVALARPRKKHLFSRRKTQMKWWFVREITFQKTTWLPFVPLIQARRSSMGKGTGFGLGSMG